MEHAMPPKHIMDLHFGRQRVSGTTLPLSEIHPHVVLFTLQRSSWQKICAWLAQRLLPRVLHRFAQPFWPIHFLPDAVVVKTLKPEWDAEFDNEKDMYAKLGILQGSLIPQFYGEARFQDTRALVLSYIDGVVPHKQHTHPPVLPPQEFQQRFEQAYRALLAQDFDYDDIRLDNVLIVGEKLMFVDLESAGQGAGSIELFEYALSDLMRRYRLYLKNIEHCAADDGIEYKAPPELMAAVKENVLEWSAWRGRLEEARALTRGMEPEPTKGREYMTSSGEIIVDD